MIPTSYFQAWKTLQFNEGTAQGLPLSAGSNAAF